MPLQSSGQITLAEVRNEFFGNQGTSQFAMSSLYGKGNAPGSGEIQLAQDFYGTSNVFVATVTWQTAVQKVGNEVLGYTSSASTFSGTTFDGATFPNSLGGISAQPSTPNITHLFRTCLTVGPDELGLEFASVFTAWTSIKIGSKTFTRTSASTPGPRSGGTSGRRYIWRNVNNTTSTYITEDSGNPDVQKDPFGTGGQNGTPSGTVIINLNY